jgi:hypothetical protein
MRQSSWRPNWIGVAVGTVVAVVALGLSVGSYNQANRSGGNYFVLYGAVLLGALYAIRSLVRTARDVETLAARRDGEAKASVLKTVMTQGDWDAESARVMAKAGTILPDWEVASRLAAENEAKEAARVREWRTNAAATFAPIVAELKAGMTAEEWEAKREDATWNLRMDREDYARYWREHLAPMLPPGTRLPPERDPAQSPLAEDWQVAMRLRPMKLDAHGLPASISGT